MTEPNRQPDPRELRASELALGRTVQHADQELHQQRGECGGASNWPASERILVCVGTAPSSSRLIRAAARMAAGLRCAWTAAYVESVMLEPLSDSDRERLEAHLRVAESLGATVTRLTGQRVSDTLVAYARQHHVTRIIIGKPTHSRWRDRLRGSLLNEVVRGSGDIDVHAISGDSPSDPAERHEPSVNERAPFSHYAVSVLIVISTLGCALALRALADLPDLEMLFLLAVMLSAVWLGRGPALAAAALGTACYDFFLVPPFHTFWVHDRAYFLTFGMMFGVGWVMSELTERVRRHERDAITREKRTGVLYALTRELSTTNQPSEIAIVATRHAEDVFGARAALLVRRSETGFELEPANPSELSLGEKDLAVARWAIEHDELAGVGTECLPGSEVLCAPVRSGASRLGVLVLTSGKALRAEQRAFLDMFCRQVAAAIERARLAEEARLTALRAKAEELRASLLSTVSHDLRTPLAAITGAATTLRDEARLSRETHAELIESIVDQAERLERLVSNLLDMTRLESGALALKKDWIPLDEIVGSALTRLEKRLDQRRITVDLGEDTPLVLVDPVLFEQLLVNLLENAEKYTPSSASIEVRASKVGDSVSLDVLDDGPGLTPGTEERIFEKFYRASHVGRVGAGLGLAICRGIAEAHGGQIRAQNRKPRGAAFHVSIPCGVNPPSLTPTLGGSG